jgi:hypothetical protein
MGAVPGAGEDGAKTAAAEDLELFRARAEEWLAANAPRERQDFDCAAGELMATRRFLADPRRRLSRDQLPARMAARQRPTAAHERAHREAAAYAPPTDLFLIGLGIVAPTILALGTPEQKELCLGALGVERCSGASCSPSLMLVPTCPSCAPAPLAPARAGCLQAA